MKKELKISLPKNVHAMPSFDNRKKASLVEMNA